MLQLNFFPFPILETERLYLRAVEPSDRHEVFAMRSNKALMQYIARPIMQTIEDAEKHIQMIIDAIEKKEFINWAITLKGDPRLIGIIGFYRMVPEHYRSEVGYMLLKDFHRKGIMHEALGAVINYGFRELKLHQVEALIDKDNIASESLLLKNKFRKEAHFKENYYFEGKFLDSVHYCRLTDLTD